MTDQEILLCQDIDVLKAALRQQKKDTHQARHVARYMSQQAGAAIGDLEWLMRHRERDGMDYAAKQTKARIEMIRAAQQRVAEVAEVAA